MCGIAGFCGQGGRADLDRMLDAVAHRGPDGQGVWWSESSPVFLGHRRLAIIDLECGGQPMATSNNQLIVTFNGEIYNHFGLRRELEGLGHEFMTDHSDTEVLLHGYRQWGDRVVERLNGMWAFAVFDGSKQRLLLSRDRFGEKPLFYTSRRGLFAFASELSSLIKHSEVNPTMSDIAMQKYFSHGYVPAPMTIYEGIYKLPAGTSLSYSIPDAALSQHRYWDFVIEPFDRLPKNPEREWAEELRFLLRQSVKRRLMSDVDLGVFLSGGVDSSTIAVLAGQESSEPIRTFTLGFEETSFDESSYAGRVATEIGSKHYAQTLSLEKSFGYLKDIVWKMDEPLGDSSLFPTWLLSRMTRRDVKVALSGDGGDELFAGYDPFAALRRARIYDKLTPRPVHAAIRAITSRLPVSHSNMSLDFRIKKALSGLDYSPNLWGPVWMAPLAPGDLNALFGSTLDPEALFSEAIEAWESCTADNQIDRMTQFFVKVYLQDDILVKTDRASMMHGLEVRAPFLDTDLVDFARRIPWQYRYRRGQRKYILKHAVSDLLPEAITNRPKKGFGAPIGKWFRSGRLQIDPTSDQLGLSKSFIEQRLDAHLNGHSDERLFLWSYWVLVNSNV